MILVCFTRQALATVNRAAHVTLTMCCLTAINQLVKRKVLIMAEYELEPCPFCGGKVSLALCDDEGNLHDEAYRERPYSGIGFMLRHTYEENLGCPIASYKCDGGILGGVYIYDTEERAAEAWNRRAGNG